MFVNDTSFNIQNDVLLGRSNYLFLWMGRQEQFAYLRGQKEISPNSKQNFIDNISNRSKFLSGRGISYKHVVFPSKPLVKKKFLPDGIAVESLYLKYPKLPSVIYPLNKLLEIEETVSTFRLLDTHMTDSGSLCVIRELINFLDPDLLSRVSFRKIEKYVSGDLAKMCGINDRSNEIYLEPFHITGEKFYFKSFNNHSALEGNSGRATLQHCVNSLTNKRLLIFGDSFFNALLPLIAPFFKDVLFIRSAFFYRELVELFKPDVVFSGNAERYLQSIPNDKDSCFFFFDNLYRHAYNPDPRFLDALSIQLSLGFDNKRYESWATNLEATMLNEMASQLILDKNFIEASHLLEAAVKLKPNNHVLKEKLSLCQRMNVA